VDGHAQAPALASLGRFFEEVEHNAEQASRLYKRALALDPAAEVAGEGLCRQLEAGGRPEAALMLCAEVGARAPQALWAFRRKGERGRGGERAGGLRTSNGKSHYADPVLSLHTAPPHELPMHLHMSSPRTSMCALHVRLHKHPMRALPHARAPTITPGYLLLDAGQLTGEEAIAAFQTALKGNLKDVGAWEGLASAYQMKGRLTAALKVNLLMDCVAAWAAGKGLGGVGGG
jgi:hypothetical protein